VGGVEIVLGLVEGRLRGGRGVDQVLLALESGLVIGNIGLAWAICASDCW
jgi:hypothetical protein